MAAKIAVTHDDTAVAIARAIDAAESRLRAAVPSTLVIYLEPDIDRGVQVAPTPGGSAGPVE